MVFMSGVDPMGADTAPLGDAFLAKPFSLEQLKDALYLAAQGPRGVQRRDRPVASSA